MVIKGNTTLKQMIAYEWCMKAGVVLNPPLHSIDDCKRDKECEVIGERIP